MDEKQIDALMDRAKTEFPDMYTNLVTLREGNPRAFNRNLQSVRRLIFQLDVLPEELRKTFKRDRSDRILIAGLVRKHRATEDEDEKKAIEKQIAEAMQRQFDDTQALREYRLKEIQKRLEDLRKQLAERKANKKQVIENRVKELIEGRASWVW